MPSLTPQELASGCWMSEYQHEGPGSTQNGHDFMIHATLEPGAEILFWIPSPYWLQECHDTGDHCFGTPHALYFYASVMNINVSFRKSVIMCT